MALVNLRFRGSGRVRGTLRVLNQLAVVAVSDGFITCVRRSHYETVLGRAHERYGHARATVAIAMCLGEVQVGQQMVYL